MPFFLKFVCPILIIFITRENSHMCFWITFKRSLTVFEFWEANGVTPKKINFFYFGLILIFLFLVKIHTCVYNLISDTSYSFLVIRDWSWSPTPKIKSTFLMGGGGFPILISFYWIYACVFLSHLYLLRFFLVIGLWLAPLNFFTLVFKFQVLCAVVSKQIVSVTNCKFPYA